MPIEYNQSIGSSNYKPEKYEVNITEWEYDSRGIRKVWNPTAQCWYHCIDDIVARWNLSEFETAIEKALEWRIGKPKIVKEIVDVMKKF